MEPLVSFHPRVAIALLECGIPIIQRPIELCQHAPVRIGPNKTLKAMSSRLFRDFVRIRQILQRQRDNGPADIVSRILCRIS